MKFLKFLIIGILIFGCDDLNQSKTPNYLSDYGDLYKSNPRKANLEWFKKSKLGLFIHYGLYSQLEKGEWVQLRDTIPVSDYAKLKETFNPSNFDADKITDLAISAGMKYITITSKHHDGFSLFDTNFAAQTFISLFFISIILKICSKIKFHCNNHTQMMCDEK